jgi:hypothetical protein
MRARHQIGTIGVKQPRHPLTLIRKHRVFFFGAQSPLHAPHEGKTDGTEVHSRTPNGQRSAAEGAQHENAVKSPRSRAPKAVGCNTLLGGSRMKLSPWLVTG